jgi:hypothetical protein
MSMRVSLTTAIVTCMFAAAASSASADPSIVGQWHLDEGSGTVASDSSGNGNDGTVLGGASWVAGRFGSALRFNGTTAVVDVPNSPSLEPPAGVTVSAWVEESGTPGAYRYIIAKGESACHSASYGLYTGASGGLAFYVYNGSGDSYVVSPNAGPSLWDGGWHLVVGTYDGAAVHLFVDGNEVGSGTARSGPIPYPSADSNDLFIGGYPDAQNFSGCQAGSFLGVIDEVNLWNRALSPQEVSSLMPKTSGGSPGGGQTPPGGSGSPPGSGTGAVHYNPPEIRSFKVSSSVASIARSGATITYTLTQAAHLSFKLQLAQAGTVRAGRCLKASSKRAGRAHQQHCTRLVTLAHFAGTGHAGINRLRFTAGVWRKLTPRRYMLAVTPSANGQTGTTVTARFTVRR